MTSQPWAQLPRKTGDDRRQATQGERQAAYDRQRKERDAAASWSIVAANSSVAAPPQMQPPAKNGADLPSTKHAEIRAKQQRALEETRKRRQELAKWHEDRLRDELNRAHSDLLDEALRDGFVLASGFEEQANGLYYKHCSDALGLQFYKVGTFPERLVQSSKSKTPNHKKPALASTSTAAKAQTKPHQSKTIPPVICLLTSHRRCIPIRMRNGEWEPVEERCEKSRPLVH